MFLFYFFLNFFITVVKTNQEKYHLELTGKFRVRWIVVFVRSSSNSESHSSVNIFWVL